MPNLNFEPAASKAVLFKKLARAQSPAGRTCWGEWLIMLVLSKTKDELREWIEKLDRDDPELGNQIVDLIVEAGESLKTRADLAAAAFARLCVIEEESRAEGGRHV